LSILDEREKTHGNYADVARVSQHLKSYLQQQDMLHMTAEQRESIEMICVKIARIVCGNANEPDHWIDISGYAELIHKKRPTGEPHQPGTPDETRKDYHPFAYWHRSDIPPGFCT